MINLTEETKAKVRLIGMAIKVANHIGHIPTDQADYNPMLDPDVLAWMEEAIFDKAQWESQQIHDLDVLDRNMP